MPTLNNTETTHPNKIIQSIADNLVLVEGGSFNMGSDNYDDEGPIHEVRLSSYHISKYPVTQAQWQAVMGNNPSHFKGDSRPVEQVSWEDCQAFIKKLNQLTNKCYRLPTEAEWEYAACGGNKSRGYTYSGSNNLDEVGWYDENSGDKTHAVGQKKPNELGLYDMSGNVYEWCNDWYGGDYYGQSPTSNPQGPSSGSDRVCRGGSWGDGGAWLCRSTDRFNCLTPSNRYSDLGFRLVSDNIDLEVLQSIADNLVLVEGGSFMMGGDSYNNERPIHEVRLSSYHISKYPVTQAQWQAVMGDNPSEFKGDARPVECVSWEYCQVFIQKLNQLTGKHYRLPTEAEWEHAARGGNKSRGYTYSGSNNLDEVAWYWENSGKETHAVGQKKPNELGLYDMSGNVYEWCNDWYGGDYYIQGWMINQLGLSNDWYGGDYYGQSPTSNPQGPSSGSDRVFRGGSWYDYAPFCRSAYRYFLTPSYRGYYLGFRLVSQ